MENDMVNHPQHYAPKFKTKSVECIDITERLPFALGNAFKYVWRAGDKGNQKLAMQDLEKACWYLKRAADYNLANLDVTEARRIFDTLEDDESGRYEVLDELLRPMHLVKKIRDYGVDFVIKQNAFMSELIKQTKNRYGCFDHKELNDKMEKIIQLYPGNEWQASMKYATDSEGDRSTSSSVSFGRWKDKEGDHWTFSILIIDEHGIILDNPPILPKGSFECTGWSLDTSIDDLFNEVCDEILKRHENSEFDESCFD